MLQEKMARLRTILEEAAANPPSTGSGNDGEVVFQGAMLDSLLDQYKVKSHLLVK